MSQSKLDQKKIQSITREIAQALNEHERKPLRQIETITQLCGEAFVRDLLKQTLEMESKGGMYTSSGDKKRTLGGVFFALAREQMPEEEKLQVFYLWVNRARKRIAQESQFESFEWDLRQDIIEQLKQKAQGEINDVKITLQGRHNEIERRQNLVITTMTHTIPESITMPAGVPHPKPFEMPYTVYIGAKQWEQVEEALQQNATDQLIVEGFAAFDAETNAMAVFALTATTTQLAKKARRESQPQTPTHNKSQAPKNAGKGGGNKSSSPRQNNNKSRRDQSGSSNVPFAPARLEDRVKPVTPIVDIPEGMGEDAAKRYTELHRAALTYRQKISDIESKPADQQFGLEMMQKLLTSTEKQIKELEAQLQK